MNQNLSWNSLFDPILVAGLCLLWPGTSLAEPSLGAIAAPAPITSADRPHQPNFIFILTDDQGYGDIGAHGHPLLKTPNFDKLHDQSVRFDNFCVSPSCWLRCTPPIRRRLQNPTTPTTIRMIREQKHEKKRKMPTTVINA